MSLENDRIISKGKEEIIIREIGERYEVLKKLKSALIIELDFQSNLASMAFDELEGAVEDSDELKIWYSVHMFLSTYECISNLLEEIRVLSEKYPDILNTEDLKSLSDISTDVDLKKKEVSNNFGMDLEKWIFEPENDRIIENHIFPEKSVPDLSTDKILRHFDPDTYQMTIRDNTYDLKQHHQVVQEIKDNIEQVYKENLWSL